jgi:hypothetical protein
MAQSAEISRPLILHFSGIHPPRHDVSLSSPRSFPFWGRRSFILGVARESASGCEYPNLCMCFWTIVFEIAFQTHSIARTVGRHAHLSDFGIFNPCFYNVMENSFAVVISKTKPVWPYAQRDTVRGVAVKAVTNACVSTFLW